MLAAGTQDTTLDDLLAAVPGHAVDDIGQHMALAKTAFQEFRALPRQAVTCGPVFTGSAEINQLAGYLLLDYDDEFGIRHVGLHLSRQGERCTVGAGRRHGFVRNE